MSHDNQSIDKPKKIIVENLSKIFGDLHQEVINLLEKGLTKDEILKKTDSIVGVCNANFSINDGEIFVVMGLSGSGKSTLVRLLNRLIEPTCGQIYFDGVDIQSFSKEELIEFRRKKVNMVFQSFALMPHMNIIDNTAFGLELAGIPVKERRATALEALNQVGLEAFTQNYPDELSGGMQQRVGLARALACNPSVMLMDEAFSALASDPELLLMDEPFSALDPLIRAEMQDELLKIQAIKRRTIVFITHDLDEAMRIGDRIAIMDGGQIIQTGTPEEILKNPANDYVASFFRGVDTAHILTAKDIAINSQVAVIRNDQQKLHVILKRLKETNNSFGYVLDLEDNLVGTVTELSLTQAITKDPDQGIAKAVVSKVETLHEDTSLRNLISVVSRSTYGVPVINQSNKYIGCITKTSLLKTLDQKLEKKNG